MVAGTVVARDKPHEASAPAKAGRVSGSPVDARTGRLRVSTAVAIRRSSGRPGPRGPRPPRGESGRTPLRPSRSAGNLRPHPPARPPHARAGPARGQSFPAGAPPGPVPASPRRSVTDGTRSSVWRSAPRVEGSTGSLPRSYPISRRGIVRRGGPRPRAPYGADTATQARLERLVAAGHNALYREERGAWSRLWLVSRASVRRPSSPPKATTSPSSPLPCRPRVATPHARPPGTRRRAVARCDAAPRRGRRGAAGGRTGLCGRRGGGPAADGIGDHHEQRARGDRMLRRRHLPGVGSLVLLAFNGLSIGASAGHFANVGLLGYLLEFTGATECSSCSRSGWRERRAFCSDERWSRRERSLGRMRWC